MKKILPFLFLTVGLNASLCDSFYDLRSIEKESPNFYVQKNSENTYFQDIKLSPEQIAKKIDQLINEGDSYSLDSLLNRTDEKIKKNILDKKHKVLDVQGKPFFTTFLNSAVYFDEPEIVKVLASHGADLNISSGDGYSPLTRAAAKKCPDIIKLLVELGADINFSDQNGNTALRIAVKEAFNDLVSLLIRLGADVNFDNKSGTTSLFEALRKNNELLAENLIENGADINAQDSEGKTALHIAIEKSYDKLAKLLVESGADVSLPNDESITPILLAASYDKKELLKLFLKKQDPVFEDYICAIIENDTQAFKTLLQYSKNNPLLDENEIKHISLCALELGNMEIVDICKDYDKDFVNNYIYAHKPLHYAVMHGHYDLAKYFIEKCKAKVDDVDYYGLTALHYAVIYGHDHIVKYLISKKADLNRKSIQEFEHYKKGITPLDLAMQFGHEDIAKLLTSNGAKNNIGSKRNVAFNKSDRLAILLDFDIEFVEPGLKQVSVKDAFSQELKMLIQQQACPVIVIGQHLLKNALKLSCSLSDWFVISISYAGVDGYLIIPKNLVNKDKKNNAGALFSKLKDLGFNLDGFKYSQVNQAGIIDKKIGQQSNKERGKFSSQVPLMMDALLDNRERSVFIGGHGINGDRPAICNLDNNDMSRMLTILDDKGTKFVYVNSCFFGGKNLDVVKDYSDMVVISGTTTEISSYSTIWTRPENWSAFFTLLGHCERNNVDIASDYLSNKVLPLLVTYKPNVTNFPRVKFPGKPFKLIGVNNRALVIDDKIIDNHKPSKTIIVADKDMVEFEIGHIKNMLEIRTDIPLFLSNNDVTVLEKLYVDIPAKLVDFDFATLIDKLIAPKIFEDSSLESVFVIQDFSLNNNFSLESESKAKINLPKRLYNVVISRGPGNKSFVFFSTGTNAAISNSGCIVYDTKTNKWNFNNSLSSEELRDYKQLLELD